MGAGWKAGHPAGADALALSHNEMDWVEGHPAIEDMAALEHNEFIPLWINSGPIGKQTKTLVMAKWGGPKHGFRIQGYTMGQYLQPGEFWCRLPVSPESCRGVIGSREK